MIQTTDPEICSILIFYRRIWNLLLHHMIFQKNNFSCYINWPHIIVWLPLLLGILNNICIVIIYYPVSNVINFEINLSFVIKQFFYIGGCLCDNWKPSFLHLLIFDWRTFSRRTTARWWRQSAKNQVSINQNPRNRRCHIVRRTIW